MDFFGKKIIFCTAINKIRMNVTGGAAKSIQSINVAAVVTAAAVAGLASPAATLKYEKTV